MFGLMTALLSCLEAQLEEEERPVDCSLVLPGDRHFSVGGQGSQAWARLRSTYPSTSVGQPDTTPGNCAVADGAELELGILRCWDAPDRDEDPDRDELERVAFEQDLDRKAIRYVLSCCPVLSPKDMLLGTYQPIGPVGIEVGGMWSFTVSVL